MERADKERVVAELAERLRQTQTLVIADYRGLSMGEIDQLRTELLKHGARFRVVKNTLTRRAAEVAGADSLLALLEGPTAIAFLESDGDPVAVAKALSDAARTTRMLAVRGGLLDGRPIGEEDVANLAKLPPAEVLRGQVLGAILSPLHMIAGLIAAPLRDLVGLIDARIEQLEAESGGEAGQPEEPGAAEPAAEEPQAVEAPPEAGDAEAEVEAEADQQPEAGAEPSETEDQPAEETQEEES